MFRYASYYAYVKDEFDVGFSSFDVVLYVVPVVTGAYLMQKTCLNDLLKVC